MTWLFILLATGAFGGFAFNAYRRNGHAMAYSAAMVVAWAAAALWWLGRLG